MTQIFYVSIPNIQKLYVYSINYSGLLTLLQILNTPGNAQPLTIHPNKRVLYIGIRPVFSIIGYKINKYGTLIAIKDKISLPGSPTYLSIDNYQKKLFCALYHNNSIAVIKLTQEGKFIKPIKILKGLIKCHSVNVEKNNDNSRLWVPCLGEDCIRIFDISLTKEFIKYSFLVKIKKYSGPRHMVFSNHEKYAYVINELNSTVSVIDIHSDYYKPKIIQTLNIIPRCYDETHWAANIHVTPNNRWLYCSDRAANIISYFKVFSNGTLKFIGYEPMDDQQPGSFAIDNTGCYLIVANQKGKNISVYTILCNGYLKLLSRYNLDSEPMWVIFLNTTNNSY
ncbi:beta-propeller fold lactonase family protein [Blochmannia endosymbiont of Colobopsis nipponica]|uniref:beta-propeller fold lactonase family protein n=1 Tax=Blochmannia endosymbiont of Colobopsis nipponica TaxID=2681987 RepID=UPI00178004C4|nr:beta-propeller fold lactonase family protein [Blochmannia endosymbiont of Colobopsis nipponica]QOI11102.1 beta-propeller fold lactonase family protein [Blochmannia endosymbiont of Colobopsis nipponica]